MLTLSDYVVIVVYITGIVVFGILVGGRQKDERDYFLGGNDLPWWAVCFSIVATETSTLTVIGVPAFAYSNSLVFLQLAIGYLLGRIVVSVFLLPRYFRQGLSTTYDFLGNRFGSYSQSISSVVFLVTRLLADGVRLFATAIPIKVILSGAGLDVSYFAVISGIGILTIMYTLIGGLKAVVWMDFVQWIIYMIGAGITIIFLVQAVDPQWYTLAVESGKLGWLDIELGRSINDIFTMPYAFVTAVMGGAVFAMASHGTDHLIVQRLLACRNLHDSQRALITSGLLVFVQFGVFLVLGVILWVYYEGVSPSGLGLSRADEIYPKYIIEGLPPGLSGLILAGIVAAAMSTLSSSLNALASSTMGDLFKKLNWLDKLGGTRLQQARMFTLFWGAVFIVFASLFQDQQNPVVEIGLAIATFTYGGLLGIFLLGVLNKNINDLGASICLIVTVVSMTLIIFCLRFSETNGWMFILNTSSSSYAMDTLRTIAWPLYTVMGASLTLLTGYLLQHTTRFQRVA